MRDLITMLIYESGRTPLLAGLMAQIDQLSDDDIVAAPILNWMRQALKLLRAERMSGRMLVQVQQFVVDSISVDAIGELRVWGAPTRFLPLDRGQLQIVPGALLWFPAVGVWIDSIFTTRGAAEARHNSILREQVNRSEYYQRVATRRNALLPSVPTLASGPLSGVRIYRV
jgi:hypothetical protein